MEGDKPPPAPPLAGAGAAATGLGGMAPFPHPDIPGPSGSGGGGGQMVADGVYVTQQVNYLQQPNQPNYQQGGGDQMVAPGTGIHVEQQVNYLPQLDQPNYQHGDGDQMEAPQVNVAPQGGGGQMVADGVNVRQQVNYLQQPNQPNYQQGGGDQMVAPGTGIYVAPQVNYLHQPNQPNYQQGHQVFDIRHVAHLHKYHRYVDMEHYVMSFLPQGETWSEHPWLLLHIRRAWAIAYVENRYFDVARTFFSDSIATAFQPILQLSQSVVRNAMLTDLTSEIHYIHSCVRDKKCYAHIYTRDGMLEKLVNDYLMLYLPNTRFTTGRKSTGLWQFAIELERKHRRPTFRCLVCSFQVFNGGTIGDMIMHLQDACPGPKMTPFLMEKYPDCGVEIARGQQTIPTIQERLATASRKKEQGRKRSRTAATEEVTGERATEDVPGETLENILQSMTTQMNRAEKLAADVGVISVQMGQVVSNMKGFLSAAQAAAAAGTGARESQLTIAAPNAVASASTSSDPFGTAPPFAPFGIAPPPDDDLLYVDWYGGSE